MRPPRFTPDPRPPTRPGNDPLPEELVLALQVVAAYLEPGQSLTAELRSAPRIGQEATSSVATLTVIRPATHHRVSAQLYHEVA